jgi:hypothetical protein
MTLFSCLRCQQAVADDRSAEGSERKAYPREPL